MNRIMATPMTPPVFAIFRIASSVLQRRCPGTSARAVAWVKITGLGGGQRVERGLIAAVGDIHRHPHLSCAP